MAAVDVGAVDVEAVLHGKFPAGPAWTSGLAWIMGIPASVLRADDLVAGLLALARPVRDR